MSASAGSHELFDWGPLPYLEVDAEGKVTRANTAACRFFGYPQAELVNSLLINLVAPVEREVSQREFKARLDGSLDLIPFERRLLHRDGTELIGEIHVALEPIFTAARGFRVAIVDLTSSRRVEAIHNEVLKSAMDAIVVIDGEGKIVEFNPAAETTFLFKRENVIGKELLETLIPDDLRAAHKMSFDRYMHTGQTRVIGAGRIEMPAMRADGTQLPVELCVSRMDVPGRTLFSGFLRDISARIRDREQTKSLIEELEMHRVRWEIILRQLPGGLMITDDRGRVIFTNDWMQALMKRPMPTLNDPISGTMLDWRTPEGAPFPAARWPPLRCLTDGEVVVRDEIIFLVDEHVQVIMEVSASTITDHHDVPIAVGCIFLDVTAQRKSEMASHASDARYRDIFERDIGANFILSRRLELTACNQAALTLFGYESKKEMFASSNAGTFPSPSDRAAILARAADEDERDSQERRIMRLHRRGGAPILALGTIRTVRDAQGRIVEYHGHFKDITEQRRAEKRIAALSTQLLRVQNEERRKLSYDLHDSAGQNLGALSMNLGLIEAALEPGSDKITAYIEECKALVQECIRDIRTISYTLHPPLLDELGVGAALKWFIEGFSKRSAITVELDLMDDLGRFAAVVEVSLFRIVQQALTNVHRHSGSKTATVRLYRDNNSVTLIVADQGRGLGASVGGQNREGEGVGFASIRQLLSYVNGSLEILPGVGTILQVIIPSKSLRLY